MKLKKVTPILRIFSEVKAKEFYIDFLGFTLDWEHRFEEGLPLYMQVSKDECILHLSEHHGDCCPGAAIRIHMDGVDDYQKELIAQQSKNARPAVQETPWGSRDMTISDPFSNKLIFTSIISA